MEWRNWIEVVPDLPNVFEPEFVGVYSDEPPDGQYLRGGKY